MAARSVVDEARKNVAKMLNARADEIVFTSGGTEGNNWVVRTAIEAYYNFHRSSTGSTGSTQEDAAIAAGKTMEVVQKKKKEKSVSVPIPHVVTSNLEHDSVAFPLRHLAKRGDITLTEVPARAETCAVAVEDIVAALTPQTCLVSLMLANNETGVLQPVKECFAAVRSKAATATTATTTTTTTTITTTSASSSTTTTTVGSSGNGDGDLTTTTACCGCGCFPNVLLHTDTAQALGKVRVDVRDLDCDYANVVGHKFYGPRSGALYVRNLAAHDGSSGAPLHAVLFGGGQERNYRPGTENVGMIAGLGAAAALVASDLDVHSRNMRAARDALEQALKDTFGKDRVVFNGDCGPLSERLPNTCNFSLLGEGLGGGRALLARTRAVHASVGAACHSDTGDKPSHILLALGVPFATARNAMRWSVGRDTTIEQVRDAVKRLAAAANSLVPGYVDVVD